MKEETRARLEGRGWSVGTATDFLDLTAEEAAFVELKVSLAAGLRREREKAGLSQLELAERVGSSQSRVSKMEAAEESVSIDLLIRTLLSLGASREDLARMMGPEKRTA